MEVLVLGFKCPVVHLKLHGAESYRNSPGTGLFPPVQQDCGGFAILLGSLSRPSPSEMFFLPMLVAESFRAVMHSRYPRMKPHIITL